MSIWSAADQEITSCDSPPEVVLADRTKPLGSVNPEVARGNTPVKDAKQPVLIHLKEFNHQS